MTTPIGTLPGKFEADAAQTLYPLLDAADQAFIRGLAKRHRLTHQELRQLAEAARDLQMWQEESLRDWWARHEQTSPLSGVQFKKEMLRRLRRRMESLKHDAKSYPANGLKTPNPPKLRLTQKRSDRKIMGMCPVASEETVCCNLRTIDAVQNCGFGCSYCTIQTFYSDAVAFDSDFREKLMALELEPERFYHIGTGQSSDSLMWGNRHGMLDDLCAFARRHPQILLELKTKSRNVRYFLKHDVPRNVVCSWSLNTPAIIDNEERFTADLENRLAAARRVADRGVGIAFHFHPMVYYDQWAEDYRQLAERVLEGFDADEVMFISFGSVTFIKPVIKAIRKRGGESKILQMDLVRDPKGKLTYPDDIKEAMFSAMYEDFAPWHDDVFFYLCMEKEKFWHRTFGFVYPDNATFERAFGEAVMVKLEKQEPACPGDGGQSGIALN